MIRRKHAGDFLAVFRVIDVANGVDRNDRTDLEIPDLHRETSDAGFHGRFQTAELADRCAGPCPAAAVLIVSAVLRCKAGRVSHVRIRPAAHIAHIQVEQVRLTHERNRRKAYVVAVSSLLQIAHHAACCIQTVGAAASQHHAVDGLRCRERIDQRAFPGGWAAASHVQAAQNAFFAQHDRNASAAFSIFCLPNGKTLDLLDRNFLHRKFSFRKYDSIIPYRP